MQRLCEELPMGKPHVNGVSIQLELEEKWMLCDLPSAYPGSKNSVTWLYRPF
jgi:hypothetical protein